MLPIPDPKQLLIGAVSFIRIGGILFTLPVFGDAPTPIQARVLIAAALTLALYPIFQASWESTPFPDDILVLSTLIFKELLVGVVIGLVARLGFDGIVGASAVVASQMGFGSDRLFMPDLEAELDGFTALHRMIVMIVFLGLGLHGVFLSALVESFKIIPPGGAHITGSLSSIFIDMTGGILVIALQLCSPVLIALLFTTAALGLVSRAVPQLNAFSLSFPLSFIVGLVVYIATIPLFPDWIQAHFSETQIQLKSVLRALAG